MAVINAKVVQFINCGSAKKRGVTATASSMSLLLPQMEAKPYLGDDLGSGEVVVKVILMVCVAKVAKSLLDKALIENAEKPIMGHSMLPVMAKYPLEQRPLTDAS